MSDLDAALKLITIARKALLKAKQTIHAFHGDLAWEIYDKNSPEMKQINDAISRLGGQS